jgi:hypothetical protein
MITTPSMGLKRWDQPNDVFSYTELSDNWALVDGHDHTTGKGVQIPTNGIANLAVTGTKIANDAVDVNKLASDAVASGKIVNDAVTTSKIANANVTDAKLASPNNGVWRTINQGGGIATSTVTATRYWPTWAGTFVAAASATAGGPVLRWVPSDYTVAGKALKMRIVTLISTNNVSPSVTMTAGLNVMANPIGASNTFAWVPNASFFTGSTFTTATLNANGHTAFSPVEFDPPGSNGNYIFAIEVGGTQGAGSLVNVAYMIQIKHI